MAAVRTRGVIGDEVWTYRYLRIGLVGAVAFLAVSVFATTLSTDRWQSSISAYYYTNSHAAFIGASCAVGLGLIAYKGSTAAEDVLLNSAGFLAFVVALVPTSRAPCPGEPVTCGQWLPDHPDLTAAVANNLGALAVAGAAPARPRPVGSPRPIWRSWRS